MRLNDLAEKRTFHTIYDILLLHIQSSYEYEIVFTRELCISTVYRISYAFMKENSTMQFT